LANLQRDQGYLGIDSNVLIAYLIPEHPDHRATAALKNENHAVNPTVLHETYHSCVFRLRRRPAETVRALLDYLELSFCLPIDSKTAKRGLKLALSHSLGGRDALILASYASSNRVRAFITFDKSLLALKEITAGRRTLPIARPDSIRPRR
jgi:predicted nucleic acid-binding protein